MEELNKITESEPETLLSSLDKFQEEIIREFLESTDNNYLECADKWLNPTNPNTALFGGEQNKSKIYRDKLLDEIEKFICGDLSYAEDRKKISESADKSEKYIIMVMSTAIGNAIGTVGTFIAPVIVLMIMSFGKMAKNAWCTMRAELKKAQLAE